MSIEFEAPGAVKPVKVEPLSEDESSVDPALLELYKDHQIKPELVVGPELVTKPPEAATVNDGADRVSLLQRDLMVRIPRLTAEALHNYKQAANYSGGERASLLQPNLMVRIPRLTAETLRNYKQAADYTDSDEIPLIRIKQEKLRKLRGSKQTIKTGKKKYRCPYCAEVFHNKKKLIKHEQKHANTKLKYECEICEKRFKVSDYLRKHIKRMHARLRRYNCRVCTLQFTSTRLLAAHMHVHTHLKHYECDLCHRKFWIKGFLARHIHKTHNGLTTTLV